MILSAVTLRIQLKKRRILFSINPQPVLFMLAITDMILNLCQDFLKGYHLAISMTLTIGPYKAYDRDLSSRFKAKILLQTKAIEQPSMYSSPKIRLCSRSRHRRTAVKEPKGSGKTEMFAKIVLLCKKRREADRLCCVEVLTEPAPDFRYLTR